MRPQAPERCNEITLIHGRLRTGEWVDAMFLPLQTSEDIRDAESSASISIALAVVVYFRLPARPKLSTPVCSALDMDIDCTNVVSPVLICSEQQKGFQTSLHIKETYCLANPNLPDCPLTHISHGFTEMTGYEAAEIIGHNCRFLQVRRLPRISLHICSGPVSS
eukprot:SAG11_NODE_3738_length_2257_cov_1.570436_2_plen_164_part_00